MLFAEEIYVFDVLWPPANDHLSLSTELCFVLIIAIDKIGFCPNKKLAAQKLNRGGRSFVLIARCSKFF